MQAARDQTHAKSDRQPACLLIVVMVKHTYSTQQETQSRAVECRLCSEEGSAGI